jgi:hypothetical protein
MTTFILPVRQYIRNANASIDYDGLPGMDLMHPAYHHRYSIKLYLFEGLVYRPHATAHSRGTTP